MLNIYEAHKVGGKGGRGRPRLTFESTVSKVLEKSHIKSMRNSRGMYEEVDDSGRGGRGM